MSYDFSQPIYPPANDPTVPQFSAPPPPVMPAPTRRTRKAGRLLIGLLSGALLIILGVLAVVSHVLLPASAATVTIVPVHQSLMQSHTFSTADHTDFTQNLIKTRPLTFKTPTRTKQEATNSTGHLDAVQATGKLRIVPLNASSSGAIKNMIIHAANGITIDTDQYPYISLSPNTVTTVPAHVTTSGKKGNVPAYFLDATYSPGDDPGLILSISNPTPFTGGRDSYDGPMIEASDIDLVESDLSQQLRQEGQQGLQSQISAGETILGMNCAPDVHSSSQSGIPGKTVKATGNAICTGTAYDQQGLQSWIQTDMQQAAHQRYGPHLGLVRQISSDVTVYTSELRIFVQSDWAVQLDLAGKLALEQAMVGKSQDEARSILSRQFFVQTKDIKLSGWGLHLPSDPQAIQLVVD